MFDCRVVSVEQGRALADRWGAKYIDASAKENQVREPVPAGHLYYLLRSNKTDSFSL